MLLRRRFAWLTLASSLAACGGPPDPRHDEDAGIDETRPASCRIDTECHDGVFCNGQERCLPWASDADVRGCVAPRTGPCSDAAACDEAMRQCGGASCPVPRDADGDGYVTAVCGGNDCDDHDPDRFPTNFEVCDLFAHDEDCDMRTLGGRDLDGDTAEDARCCNRDASGAMRCGLDCDDTRADTSPMSPEVCDHVDNNCNGIIDEGRLVALYRDDDGDLHGEPSSTIQGCFGDPGTTTSARDCDDDDPAVHRAQLEVCDGRDNDCNEVVDDSPMAAPWYPDDDGDGFGDGRGPIVLACLPPAHYALIAGDCDDSDPDEHPRTPEVCNGLDDDCDGVADHRLGPGDGEDDDADGFVDHACGYGASPADCDDDDPLARPNAPELADGRDNDCDGEVDESPTVVAWYADADGDGFGDLFDPAPRYSATVLPGRTPRSGDCDDTRASVHPHVRDDCNGTDDDCDGVQDEDAVNRAYFADADGDGFGDPMGAYIVACTAPSDYATDASDCDDRDALAFPGALERCNGRDDDCNGPIDDGQIERFHEDRDGDGFGDATAPHVEGICAPEGYGLAGDCDDDAPEVHPGAPDVCNGADDDCDGEQDDVVDANASCSDVNTVGECIAEVCVITECANDREDCDALASTGCESDVGGDPDNCGGCGLACGAGGTCSSGVCSPFVEIDAGGRYTCGRRANGRVVCWGENDYGQLGSPNDGTSTPREVPGITNAIALSTGFRHACALLATRRLLCWGDPNDGRLGHGSETTTGYPVQVVGIDNAVAVAAGAWHTCAALASGQVRCWGRTAYGALGTPYEVSGRSTPVTVAGIANAIGVVAGRHQSYAITPTAIIAWGRNNDEGWLGVGPGLPSTVPPTPLVSGATIAPSLRGLACSQTACCASSAGGIACWGAPLGPATALTDVPVSVGPAMPVDGLAIGRAHLCYRLGGTVSCAGSGEYGHLGSGNLLDSASFAPVSMLADAVSLGDGNDTDHTCVVREGGRVACWGRGEGVGIDADALVPHTLPELR